MARENLIARTFVELADTLVEGYDPIEFLHHLAERCVEVLATAEAGLVLVDARGQLQALASSSERMHLIELLEVQHEDGPCLDCWRSGNAVAEDHLADAAGRWPLFASAALQAGFASVYAVPMRHRDERLGALNLFANEAAGLADTDLVLAQAMADGPRSASSTSGSSPGARRSPSNFRWRSTHGWSSSRPRASSPSR